MSDGIDRLVDILDIEELDQNLYRGQNLRREGRYPLFGGQVAAQALVAAARTVPEGRFPHSLHGYFLRSGQADHPVILRVERDRDGRSFSARHVVAVQNGEVIFDLSASFQVETEGFEWQADTPTVEEDPERLVAARPEQVGPAQLELFDIRVEPSSHQLLDSAEPPPISVPYRLWLRSKGALPDDRLLHTCILAYVSDLGSGLGRAPLPGSNRGGPSLDHAVWFHHPVRIDDWLLIDHYPVAVSSGRGFYRGSVIDRQGLVTASIVQEHLLRRPT